MSKACRRTALLLCLLLNMVDTDATEITFRQQGQTLLVDGCLASQNMRILRVSGNGEQLLVNSSARTGTLTLDLHQDLRGRASFAQQDYTSMFLIKELQAMDDGVYIIECWKNATLLSTSRKQLVVCSESEETQEIAVLEDGQAEVRCQGSPGSLADTTVRWYYVGYNTSLLLDSATSLDLMLEDLQGKVQVEDGGALLRLSDGVLDRGNYLFCILMEGQKCLGVKNQWQSVADERNVYALPGERVALPCAPEHNGHSWHTPMGKVTTTTESSGQMYVSGDSDSKRGSLIIPAVSDNHAGEYSCFSPTLVVKHHLTLCPRGEPRVESVVEGGVIVLECSVPGTDSDRQWLNVRWHREIAPGQASLIYPNRGDATPQARNRTILSSDGFSLTLSGLTAEGAGMYWCIVSKGAFSGYAIGKVGSDGEKGEEDEERGEEEEGDQADPNAYENEPVDDDDYDYGDAFAPWNSSCISKQVFILNMAPNLGRVQAQGLTPAPASGGGPEHGLAAAVAVLSVVCVGLIAALAVMKKRPKACFKQGDRSAETRQGANFRQDAGAAGEMLERGGAANDF